MEKTESRKVWIEQNNAWPRPGYLVATTFKHHKYYYCCHQVILPNKYHISCQTFWFSRIM